ncbi:arsenosugar biosynthesis radical SAM (seleno)protein ArsS [Lewinella sp. JB7]|uniref:arsenosugar biosynthesis radical SAM (seleno)protein ArsS n=1 Tax=Lewinella sp. JB7 TaxID=2962887 RepID=UPI0020C9A1C3|nr:arsenosugar biosynthesis radical SAM (seleno)protein ArsS [Lewinella sp. JB7]MCP9235391.1 arsenosugar biosynthesis radical SAM protein ArsS [Lewinella sp. JB7]
MGVKQKTQSLKRKGSDLTSGYVQLNVLNGKDVEDARFPRFADRLADQGHRPFKPTEIEIFQLNIGKLCNQTCAHCHVDAGPDRKEENMNRADLELCVAVLAASPSIKVVDITGGAPEMNPHFRWFVEQCTALGKRVIDRCNLTIIMANPKYRDLPEFLAKHRVQVVSSLPYFSKGRTDGQRGDGVFEDSIKALQLLNDVGYGQPGTGLKLDLVFNPSGAYLPGKQETLQAEFKRQLDRKYGIVFNELYAITNLPVSRFLDYLLESGNYGEYMQKLVDAYNPATVDGLMCRNTISVSWDGYLYDCDFNQMLDLKVASKGQHLRDFDLEALRNRNIVLNQHCYGCTAGAGSSCGGTVA